MANTAMINHDFAPNGARIVPWSLSTNILPLTGLRGIRTVRGAAPERGQSRFEPGAFKDFKVSLPARSVRKYQKQRDVLALLPPSPRGKARAKSPAP